MYSTAEVLELLSQGIPSFLDGAAPEAPSPLCLSEGWSLTHSNFHAAKQSKASISPIKKIPSWGV